MIVLNIISGVAYVVAMFFVGYAFAMLHNIKRRQEEQYCMQRESLAMQMMDTVKASMEMLHSLQGKLQATVRDEDYEAAERLNKAIKEHEKGLMKQIDALNKRFGDIVEVKITSAVNTKPRDE